MHVEDFFITESADSLIRCNSLAKCAYDEVVNSINNMVSCINNSAKNCNGVVPVKEPCYQLLEEQYSWFREKPLSVLSDKGGPIDVYKSFYDGYSTFNVGIEFETGNISSAHRALNKLMLGIDNSELDLGIILLPMHRLSYYLTDRVSNYEELQPYFRLVQDVPFIIFGFDVEEYSPVVSCLPKGRDGMSHRSIRRWSDKVK